MKRRWVRYDDNTSENYDTTLFFGYSKRVENFIEELEKLCIKFNISIGKEYESLYICDEYSDKIMDWLDWQVYVNYDIVDEFFDNDY